MKKVKVILSLLLISCILLSAVGCSKAESDTTADKSVDVDYMAEIDGLKQQISELSEDVDALQGENKTLKSENDALEKSIKDIEKASSDDKYSITKEELIGTWHTLGNPDEDGLHIMPKYDNFVFTKENIISIKDGWIIFDRELGIGGASAPYAMPYRYYKGILYMPDNGWGYKKK